MKKKKFNFTFSADNGLVDRRCFLKSGFGVGAGEGGSVGAFVGCDDKKMVVNEIIKEINLKK